MNDLSGSTPGAAPRSAMRSNTRRLVILSLLAAVAYVVVVLGRIPVVLFLSYEPKDVVITIAGFIYGPLSAFAVSCAVSLLEMLTISATGPIGCVMNILSTCSFACTAAVIYKKRRRMSGAVVGLFAGAAAMVCVMMLWNYLITPIWLGYPRGEVAAMLVPYFLPFNLLKSGLNTALALLLYKPVVGSLRRANLLPPSGGSEHRSKYGVALFALALLITCVLLLLVVKGVI